MAISDILSDAADEIQDCLRFQPKAYAPWKERLDRLVQDMDIIRAELDTPPND